MPSSKTLRRKAKAKKAAAAAAIAAVTARVLPSSNAAMAANTNTVRESPSSVAGRASSITPTPRKRGRPVAAVPHLKQVRIDKEAKERAAKEKDDQSKAIRAKLRGGGSNSRLDSIPEEGGEEDDDLSRAHPKKKSCQGPTRTTRSNPGMVGRPTRFTKNIERFEATPACAINRPGHNPWTKSNQLIDSLTVNNESLVDERDGLLRELSKSRLEMAALNKQLLARDEDQEGDSRPISHDPPRPFEAKDLRDFVKVALSNERDNPISPDLVTVLQSLGLDKHGRVSQEASKESFVKGIRLLVDFHFGRHDECQHADIMGELLFNGNIFSRDASNKASEKIARSMTSCVFNAVELLKAIDMKAGSLNDHGIDEYAKIEKDTNLTSPPEGKTMLRPRHNVSRARKIANGLVDQLFTVDESHRPSHTSDIDQVMFDPERLFRFMLDVFKLKDKALQGKLKFGIAGDAAAVCTSTNTASQSLFGFKIIDEDAFHPLTNELLLCKFIDDDVHDDESDEPGSEVPTNRRRVYHSAQSNICCCVSAAVMAKETEAMESEAFKRLIDFVKKLESKGIDANGDEPALPPQPGGLVGCGDLSFQQKMSGHGGACKVMRCFCTYCSTESGAHDLLGYVWGEDICERCIRNKRTQCPHVPVDDHSELKRKGQELVEILLDDFKRKSANENATVRDMMPSEPVDCFVGYTAAGEKITEKVELRNEMNEDCSVFTRHHLYDYSRHLCHSSESEVVLQQSAVKLDSNAIEKSTSTTNIEYVYGDNQVRDDIFTSNVTMDLILRGYKNSELPSDKQGRQALLLTCLMTQRKVRKNRNALKNNEDALATQILNPGVLACCILHAKMRMVEKFMQQLILAGMRKNSTGQRFKDYCAKVESAVNQNILRRTTCNARNGQWQVPLDKKDKKKLGDVKLSGSASTKFMTGLEYLVDACTSDYSQAYTDEWKDAGRRLNLVMEMLESKEEFNQDRVDNFQLLADEFCDVYCQLTGRDGMTNYYHILRSGHFSYFLSKYKSLYLLSQQGWENVNSRFKRSFHNNTQKGGGVGGSSKLAPVMYMMARDMLWSYGFLDGLFKKLGHTNEIDVDYGDVKRIPFITNETHNDTRVFAETILRFGSYVDVFGEVEEEIALEPIIEGDDEDGVSVCL